MLAEIRPFEEGPEQCSDGRQVMFWLFFSFEMDVGDEKRLDEVVEAFADQAQREEIAQGQQSKNSQLQLAWTVLYGSSRHVDAVCWGKMVVSESE